MKLYSKPEIHIERFNMDIDVLATIDSNSNLYKELLILYKLENGIGEDDDVDENEFQKYLKDNGFDNSTSMFCYHTYNTLS